MLGFVGGAARAARAVTVIRLVVLLGAFTGLAVVVVPASVAVASEVSIQGASDTNGSLIIDPHEDPQTATFGDISTGDCSQPTTLDVSITDVTTNQGIATSDRADITGQLGRVAWHFPATTLLKGHRYAFERGSALGCGWWQLQQRTWAGPTEGETGQVEAPEYNTGCLHGDGPAGASLYGMWHVEGQNDAVSCDPSPYDGVPVNFSPDMPTGWLVVNGTNWIPRIVQAAGNYDHQPPDSNCPFAGQHAVWWRQSPGLPAEYADYLCAWSQFLPSGTTSSQAFAWSEPWPQATGQPRVGYAKLDTIDYDALLQQYSPTLIYDSHEPYFAMRVESITNLDRGRCAQYGYGKTNLLNVGLLAKPVASTGTNCPVETLPRLDLSWLRGGGQYPSGDPVSGDDFLYESDQTYADDASYAYYTQGDADWIYGRVTQDQSGATWLQYWLWYYYNDGRFVANGFDHEGDWENVQIKLDQGLEPVLATAAQHNGFQTCEWGEVKHDDATHPIIYPALGRHASYFELPASSAGQDSNDGGTDPIRPSVEVVTSTTPWIQWPGRWGTSGGSLPLDQDSPRGPIQHDQWREPGSADQPPGSNGVGLCADVPAARTQALSSGQASVTGLPSADLTATLDSKQVQVSYRIPGSTSVDRLVLSAHSQSPVPTTTVVHIDKRRRGTVTIPVPRGEPPYIVKASVFGKAGRGPLATAQVQ